MKPEGQSVFCYYHTQCQKQRVIVSSPSRQHNAHTVPTTVTESLGFGTEPGSPEGPPSYITRPKTILALRHLWEARSGYIQDSPVFPMLRFNVLYSFTTPLEGWRKNDRKDLRRYTISRGLSSKLVEWCMKKKKARPNVSPYKHFALCAHINLILLSAGSHRFREIICLPRFTSLHQRGEKAEHSAATSW